MHHHAHATILDAGLRLRALFAPLWARTHEQWVKEGTDITYPTPSSMQCATTVLTMGGTTGTLKADAQPGESGFLAFRSGWMFHPTDGRQPWHPHAWIGLEGGWMLDLTADQFGYDPVLLTPPSLVRTLTPGMTRRWALGSFDHHDDAPIPHATYACTHRPQIHGLAHRNRARAWLRTLLGDPTTTALFDGALLDLRAAATSTPDKAPS